MIDHHIQPITIARVFWLSEMVGGPIVMLGYRLAVVFVSI